MIINQYSENMNKAEKKNDACPLVDFLFTVLHGGYSMISISSYTLFQKIMSNWIFLFKTNETNTS
jgi:hypothetical protein